MDSTQSQKSTKTTARQFTVYLPRDLNRWLRECAKREGRTLTKQTEMVLLAGQRMLMQKPSKHNWEFL